MYVGVGVGVGCVAIFLKILVNVCEVTYLNSSLFPCGVNILHCDQARTILYKGICALCLGNIMTTERRKRNQFSLSLSLSLSLSCSYE